MCCGIIGVLWNNMYVLWNYRYADLFTTTFSPYLLRFFTVNYALRLNLTILRLNKQSFFKICLYRKGHTVIDHSERHYF